MRRQQYFLCSLRRQQNNNNNTYKHMQLCLCVRVCVNILLIIIEINNFLNVHTAQSTSQSALAAQRKQETKLTTK